MLQGEGWRCECMLPYRGVCLWTSPPRAPSELVTTIIVLAQVAAKAGYRAWLGELPTTGPLLVAALHAILDRSLLEEGT
jgi:hypothetical protein